MRKTRRKPRRKPRILRFGLFVSQWIRPWTLLHVFTWISLHTSHSRYHRGIALLDKGYRTVSDAKLKAAYFTMYCDALDLLRTCDPRRFHLVQRELHYVIIQYTAGRGAEYDFLFRRCLIDLESLVPTPPAPEDPAYRWYVASIAATLIHEATHGRIMRYYIPYDTRSSGNWERIERLCRKQEQCFAERVLDTTYDYSKHLVGPLNVDWYRAYFEKSFAQKIRELVHHLRQVWK